VYYTSLAVKKKKKFITPIW